LDSHLIIFLLILLAIAGAASLVARLFRVGITLIALAVILPILCTILWGDGEAYVSKFASIFTPEIEEQITEGYRCYKEQDSKDPILDYEQVEEYAGSAMDRVKDAFSGLFGRGEDNSQSNAVFTSSITGSGPQTAACFFSPNSAFAIRISY